MTGGGDGKTRSSSSNRIEAAGVVFGEASAAFSEVEARPLDVAQVEDCRVRGSLATCSEVNQEFGCQAPSSTLCVASKSGSRLQTGSAVSSANTTRQDATDSGTLASVNLQKLQRFCCAAEALGSLPYVVIYTHIHISTHGNKSIHTYIHTYVHTYIHVLVLIRSYSFFVTRLRCKDRPLGLGDGQDSGAMLPAELKHVRRWEGLRVQRSDIRMVWGS